MHNEQKRTLNHANLKLYNRYNGSQGMDPGAANIPKDNGAQWPTGARRQHPIPGVGAAIARP